MIGQAFHPGHLGQDVWRQSDPSYSPFLNWVSVDRGEKVGLVLREERDPVVRGHILCTLDQPRASLAFAESIF